MLTIFLLLILVVVLNSRNLVLILLLLEILGFFLIFFISSSVVSFAATDFISLMVFSLLVIEGVIALSGLISLVSFSGGDYLVSSSILNF